MNFVRHQAKQTNKEQNKTKPHISPIDASGKRNRTRNNTKNAPIILLKAPKKAGKKGHHYPQIKNPKKHPIFFILSKKKARETASIKPLHYPHR